MSSVALLVENMADVNISKECMKESAGLMVMQIKSSFDQRQSKWQQAATLLSSEIYNRFYTNTQSSQL